MVKWVGICCAVLFSFSSCNDSKSKDRDTLTTTEVADTLSLPPKSKRISSLADTVLAHIKPAILSATAVTSVQFQIENRTNDTVSFGNHVTLEKRMKSEWEDTHGLDAVVFNDILIICAPNCIHTQKIGLDIPEYKYQPGMYRIRKELTIGGSTVEHFAVFWVRE